MSKWSDGSADRLDVSLPTFSSRDTSVQSRAHVVLSCVWYRIPGENELERFLD